MTTTIQLVGFAAVISCIAYEHRVTMIAVNAKAASEAQYHIKAAQLLAARIEALEKTIAAQRSAVVLGPTIEPLTADQRLSEVVRP